MGRGSTAAGGEGGGTDTAAAGNASDDATVGAAERGEEGSAVAPARGEIEGGGGNAMLSGTFAAAVGAAAVVA